MKHIAMTLGPITNTMMLGRKTSEIWGASYLFSSFMKAVIKELKSKSGVQFLIPYVGDESLFNTQDDGIGMFHDRFIFTSENLTLNDINLIPADTDEKTLSTQDINYAQLFSKYAKYCHNFNGSGELTEQKFFGTLGCNGTVYFKFASPVYLWLLENM